MKGTRRNIYFKANEFDLLHFIESKTGNFSTEAKEILKRVKDFEETDEIRGLMMELKADIAEIKTELQLLKQLSLQITVPALTTEKEVLADERDYSGFADL